MFLCFVLQYVGDCCASLLPASVVLSSGVLPLLRPLLIHSAASVRRAACSVLTVCGGQPQCVFHAAIVAADLWAPLLCGLTDESDEVREQSLRAVRNLVQRSAPTAALLLPWLPQISKQRLELHRNRARRALQLRAAHGATGGSR